GSWARRCCRRCATSARNWGCGARSRPTPPRASSFPSPRIQPAPPPSRRPVMRVPADTIRTQLVSVLRAWGMSDAHAGTTAEMMVETDLRGVDSHGISMLPTYDREFRAGRLNMRPSYKTVREGPAFALIDADASLGHPVSVYAMNLAV